MSVGSVGSVVRRSRVRRPAGLLLAGLALVVLSACDAGAPPAGLADPSAPVATSDAVSPTPSATGSESPTRTRSPRTPKASSAATTGAATSAPATTDSYSVPTTPAAPTSVPTFAATSTDAPRADDAPRTYAQARRRVSALRGGSARELPRFSTPKDRIYCVLGDDVLGTACELRTGGIEDPEVCAGTLGDRVGRLELTRAGVIPQCNTDTIREPGATTVSPDALIVGGGVACAVEASGVTCVDEEKRLGFFLAPGRYATFG